MIKYKTIKLLDYTSISDAYPGFDWFSTSIFLLMGCDDIRSWRWLRTFALLLPAGFLWHARLFNTVFKQKIYSIKYNFYFLLAIYKY